MRVQHEQMNALDVEEEVAEINPQIYNLCSVFCNVPSFTSG